MSWAKGIGRIFLLFTIHVRTLSTLPWRCHMVFSAAKWILCHSFLSDIKRIPSSQHTEYNNICIVTTTVNFSLWLLIFVLSHPKREISMFLSPPHFPFQTATPRSWAVAACATSSTDSLRPWPGGTTTRNQRRKRRKRRKRKRRRTSSCSSQGLPARATG